MKQKTLSRLKQPLVTLVLSTVFLSLTACQTMPSDVDIAGGISQKIADMKLSEKAEKVSDKLADMKVPGFKKELTPEPMYVPDIVIGEPQVLIVSSKRISCNSQKPMQCLVAIPEGAYDMNSVIDIPFDGINGFIPRPNIQYKISASPLIDKNQPFENQITGRWQLQSILSQKTVY